MIIKKNNEYRRAPLIKTLSNIISMSTEENTNPVLFQSTIGVVGIEIGICVETQH